MKAPAPEHIFLEKRRELFAQFNPTAGVTPFLRRLTEITDEAVLDIARASLPLNGVFLAAVGGYGRKEIFPYSDIDVLILLRERHDKNILEAVSDFMNRLWLLGPEVGHSVHTLKTCGTQCQKDIAFESALFDTRFLYGDTELFKELRLLISQLDPIEFGRKKIAEREKRYRSWNLTPYALEPNLKESPGGIRDIHFVHWLSQAMSLHDAGKAYSDIRIFSDCDAECSWHQASETVFKFRAGLQLCAKRSTDVLNFERRARTALTLGFNQNSKADVSAMFAAYFKAAKIITAGAELAKAVFSDFKSDTLGMRWERLSPDLLTNGELAELGKKGCSAEVLAGSFLARHNFPEALGMGPELLRRVLSVSKEEAAWCPFFKNVLALPRPYEVLSEMHSVGFLCKVLPPFAWTEARIQDEMFHEKTVDTHSLDTVREAECFINGGAGDGLLSKIARTIKDKRILYFSCLLHDVGKGRGGSHAEIGAAAAEDAALKLGFSKDEASEVAFLVRNHLRMSLCAQKEDYSDPEVLTAFCKEVNTHERLKMLYVLTVCDIRATGGSLWTQWKGSLLTGLFLKASTYLSGAQAESKGLLRNKLAESIAGAGLDSGMARVWASRLPEGYPLGDSLKEAVLDAASALRRNGAISVRVSKTSVERTFRVFMYAPDASGLFLNALSFFQRLSLNVLRADLGTSEDGYAFDVFIVEDVLSRPEAGTISEIASGLPGFLIRGAAPASGAPRFSRLGAVFQFDPKISFEDAPGQCWILHVKARDRLGLLYEIAFVLEGFYISFVSAKIMTMGDMVEDDFLVKGNRLEDAACRREIVEKLIGALR